MRSERKVGRLCETPSVTLALEKKNGIVPLGYDKSLRKFYEQEGGVEVFYPEESDWRGVGEGDLRGRFGGHWGGSRRKIKKGV